MQRRSLVLASAVLVLTACASPATGPSFGADRQAMSDSLDHVAGALSLPVESREYRVEVCPEPKGGSKTSYLKATFVIDVGTEDVEQVARAFAAYWNDNAESLPGVAGEAHVAPGAGPGLRALVSTTDPAYSIGLYQWTAPPQVVLEATGPCHDADPDWPRGTVATP